MNSRLLIIMGMVATLATTISASGMHGMRQSQDADKVPQHKKQSLDNTDIQTQRLERELGLDELQKIKVEKFANQLKDNLAILNNSRLEYEQFITKGSFDKQAFLVSAQKKTKLLAEVQSDFIEKLFSILDDSQKSKIKKIPLLLLWQKEEFGN